MMNTAFGRFRCLNSRGATIFLSIPAIPLGFHHRESSMPALTPAPEVNPRRNTAVGGPDAEAQPPQAQKAKPKGFVDRWWHARIWLGFSFGALWPVLWHNRFAVSPHRIAMVLFCLSVSIGHSCFRALQTLIYGRRIAGTEIADGPVFIIGHWRSGTTLLHELLAQDPRHAYPTNYQCFAPHHFLLTEWWCKRIFGFLLPKQRPMDNMAVGWDRPQEDEFALCALGVPSPYWVLGFPNRPQCEEYLDLQGVPEGALERWKQALIHVVKLMTFRYAKRNIAKRVILKSPTHTARVGVLSQIFPRARFIHIVRDPRVLFPSTVNLWKKLCETQHIQTPRFEGLEEFVFRTFERMYAAYDRDRAALPANRLYEVRYEDLVRDPLGQLRAIYRQLELGDFEPARPGVERYLAEVKDYQTNRYEIAPAHEAEIRRRWGGYMQRYGYDRE